MSEEKETMPLEIGLGSYIGLRKGGTLVTGLVLEKISLEDIDLWFYMDSGWGFIEMTGEDEDAEV
jgi:hypothetical protein